MDWLIQTFRKQIGFYEIKVYIMMSFSEHWMIIYFYPSISRRDTIVIVQNEMAILVHLHRLSRCTLEIDDRQSM